MKKIIFTGGGTGGHIMPNVAIIEQLKGKYDLKYIGSKNGMEKAIVEPIVPFFEITTCKLKRSLSPSNLLIPFKLFKGYKEAKEILKREKPDLVFSKGGYVAVPVVFACKKLKIPVVSHESDYSIGLANRLTCKYASAVCTSFEDTASKLENGVYTGSPIRKCVLNGNKEKAKRNFSLKENLPTILIVGGSLGSQSINNLVFDKRNEICKKFNVIHITGKNSTLKSDLQNYNILPYSDSIGDIYAISDLIVTRGGSNVLFELLALKRRMIIIPLEKASRGDQVLNAKVFENENLAMSVSEKALEEDENLLVQKIDLLWNERDNFVKSMEKKNINGNKEIVKQIEKYVK